MQFEQQEYATNYEQREQQPLYRQEKLQPERKRRRKFSWLLGAGVICILLLLGWSLLHSPLTSRQSQLSAQSFTFASQGTLVVHGGAGTIHVHGANTTTVLIQGVTHEDGLDSQSNPANYQHSGNTITIDTNDGSSLLGDHYTDFEITVPASMNLNIVTGSGAADIAGVNGSVALHSGSGNQSLINISSADIFAETGSGNIQGTNISGQAHFSTGAGGVDISQGHLSGQTTFQTGSGSIHYSGSLDTAGTYILKTGSGSVTLTLPASSAFLLKTSTGAGHVHNDFGSDSVGQSPQASLLINTGSGGITITQG